MSFDSLLEAVVIALSWLSSPIMYLTSSFWFNVFALAITWVIVFVVEVAMIMNKSEKRPSTGLAYIGRQLYAGFAHLATFLSILADVFGFVRRFVLWVRSIFFKWIPREIILQALHDLGKALGQVLQSPKGFFVGLWKGVKDATLPWLTGLFLFLMFVVAPLFWEVALLLLGSVYRPSTFLFWIGGLLKHKVFYPLGYLISSLKDLPTFLKAVVGPIFQLLFGWIPTEAIDESVHNLANATWNVSMSGKGFVDGLGTWTIAPENLRALFFLAVAVVAFVLFLMHLRGYFESANMEHPHERILRSTDIAVPQSSSSSVRKSSRGKQRESLSDD